MLEELIVTAAVGTGRKTPALPAMGPALDDALGALANESPEGKLLGAVAILTRYQTCGRVPALVSIAQRVAEPETLPPCTRRAGDLLVQIMAMPNNETKLHLTDEWLALATRTKRRAPHRILPALLDHGAGNKAAQAGIANVCGTRGQWLMGLNPRWKFEVAGGDDPVSLWNTGTRDQRVAMLTRLRQTDSSVAREMISSTWKEDAAEDRSIFVAAMLAGLGSDDVPFFEACLDDRSKQVRSAAAELLARMPESAFVKRMIERATPLLKYSVAKKGPVLEITLPPEAFPADWARDGIIEKPDSRIGRRQWWLQQILAAIPPPHWSSLWNATPGACIAAVTEEFEDVVLSAWHHAAARNSDTKWIAALLLAAAKDGRGPMTLGLLNSLPNDARQAIATEILESPRSTIDTVMQLLRAVDFPLDRHSTNALFTEIERHLAQQTAGYAYHVIPILQAAALRVPPESYDALATRCTGEKWESNRKAVDEFFLNLQIRRDLLREFNP